MASQHLDRDGSPKGKRQNSCQFHPSVKHTEWQCWKVFRALPRMPFAKAKGCRLPPTESMDVQSFLAEAMVHYRTDSPAFDGGVNWLFESAQNV